MISPERGTLDVSAVVPIYNEIENLPPLLVGSSGAPGDRLMWRSARRRRERRRQPQLARTETQRVQIRAVPCRPEAARRGARAGLAYDGRVIVTLMATQNDPADLSKLLAALEHANVVSGARGAAGLALRCCRRASPTARPPLIGDR
jgi:hypothetical protein